MLRSLLHPFSRRAGVAKRKLNAHRILSVESLEERQLLTAVPTLTTLSASANTSIYGQPLTLTATVIVAPPNTGTPSGGTVTFLDGTSPLASPVTLSNSGVATLPLSTLPAGLNALTADYNGNSNYVASASPAGPNSLITTVAGGGTIGDGGPATAAALHSPEGVAVDATGDIFIADTQNNRIREVEATGNIITVAGGGSSSGTDGLGDGGPATAASLNYPTGVTLDAAGDIFIADSNNQRIREVIKATGDIITVAGNGGYGYSGDGGPATASSLSNPQGVAVDAAGDIFIADSNDQRIREVVKATGIISTVAGGGTSAGTDSLGDGGPATTASLNDPTGVALDAAGDIFIADSNNQRIREVVKTTGNIVTVAGGGSNFGTDGVGDGGSATMASLQSPSGVAVDSTGDIFIADSDDQRIREVAASTGTITTVAGGAVFGQLGDGHPASAAWLGFPQGVATDAAGNLIIADTRNNRIREVAKATGDIITVAGGAGGLGDGDSATTACLNPAGVAVDAAGDIFIADQCNQRIQEVVKATGDIITVAGDGILGYRGDGGPATAASLYDPTGVAVDAVGDIFIADSFNCVIREVVKSSGNIITVAGNGSGADGGYGGDGGDGGPATAAALNYPTSVAVDAAGDLFIADSGNNRIREVIHGSGEIITIAGNGTGGYSGDGGLATAASLNNPQGVAVDAAGDVFIADSNNDRIREVVQATGNIVTVAGGGYNGGTDGWGDGGPATAASLNNPQGVAVDAAGDIFIADSGNSRIREVVYTTGDIVNVAGNVFPGPVSSSQNNGGDGGQASAATFAGPSDVAVDAAGDIFIVDDGDDRIREVDAGVLAAVNRDTPTLSVTDAGGTYNGQPFAASATVAGVVAGVDNTPGSTLQGVPVTLDYQQLNAAGGSPIDLHATAPTALGSYLVVASFAGSADYSAASDWTTFNIVTTGITPTTTAIVASTATLVVGQPVTFTATVSSTAGTPTGTVTFMNGTTALGSPVTLNSSGVATLQLSTLPSGLNVVTASYSGDNNYAVSTSPAGPNSLITTVAGGGSDGDGGPATAASLFSPQGVAVDTAGDIYIADSQDGLVREVVKSSGDIITVAGGGNNSGSDGQGDGGAATTASLSYPTGVAVDAQGDIFIVDCGNNEVREVVKSTGDITTVAGGANRGNGGYSGDGGPATAASLNWPQGIAVDVAGDIFIADTGNNVIREVVKSTGDIITVAGGGDDAGTDSLGDGGRATAASLSNPAGVALDAAGDLFIADQGDQRIREVVKSTGDIITVAGGGSSYNGDNGDVGAATAATLNSPQGIVVDAAGDLFIADAAGRIREVNVATGNITTVAGSGIQGFSGDGGAATAASFNNPTGVAVDAAGDLFIADGGNNRIREVVNSTGNIITVAGGTAGLGDGGAATAAFLKPVGVAVDAQGDIFIADTYNDRIREVVKTTGDIVTVAGNGILGYSGDGGPATAASLGDPQGIALDAAGDIFIADWNNNVIREVVKATGDIITVAGGGNSYNGDNGDGGPATAASLGYSTGVAVDAVGDIFIADSNDNVIREVVHTTGDIITVAGGGTNAGSDGLGDGGAATTASLSSPQGVAVDTQGDIFIADSNNNLIREVVKATGEIIAVAGNGTSNRDGSPTGDGGPATAASLNNPTGVAVDAAGNLFIADEYDARIREVVKSTGNIITVVADLDNNNWCYDGDGGPASAAALNNPTSVAVNAAGDLFIADSGNQRIREVDAGALAAVSPPLTFTLAGPTAGTFTAGQSVTVQWTVGGVVAGNSPTIGLGYDQDATGFDANQQWITAGVTAANGAATYAWNTANASPGTYYLNGYLSDPGESQTVYSHLGTAIVIKAGTGTPTTFTLTGPTGTVVMGQTLTFQWTATGVVAGDNPTISLGGDQDPTPFDANQEWAEVGQVSAADGTGSYSLQIGGGVGGTLYAGGYLYDPVTKQTVYSALTTPIVITDFALTAPSARTFAAGQSVTIQWMAGNVDVAGPTNITLGYDADSTAFDTNEHWIEVNQVTAANGTAAYTWNASGVAAGTYYLAGYMYDSSTGQAVYSSVSTPIVITSGAAAPTFTMAAPSAETFTVGQSITIQWSAANVDVAGPTKITLGYDADSTAFDANEHWIEVNQVTAANGATSYIWNTSGMAAGTYYLAGYTYDSATGKAVYSSVSTPIVIASTSPPAFTLTGPSVGTFAPGQTVTIQWSAANIDVAGPTKITLGYDADSTAFDVNEHWIEVDQVSAANGAASYSWNTSGVAAGTYYVAGYMYDSATGQTVYSHLATSIVIASPVPAAFTLSGPSAGTFTVGQSVTIQWSAANVDVAGPTKITLGYDRDATAFDANERWIEVDQVTAANGAASYTWNTSGVAAGTYYLAGYLYDSATGQAVYSHLGSPIAITVAAPVSVPTFAFSGPSAGTFTVGQNIAIQWSAANVDVAGPTTITLGYDADATAFDANEHWIEVDQVTAVNGAASYTWNTSGVAAGTYYLSGYLYDSSTGQTVYSHLSSPIAIAVAAPVSVPTFVLTGPSSGTFTVGQSVTIQWSAANVDVAGPTRITLGYDADSTAFDANEHWIEVDQVTAANGAASYSWNTAGMAAGTYHLSGYVYDFSTDKTVYSHLATSIVITAAPAPTFTLSGPIAGTFTPGQSVTIQWSAANVDVAGPSKITLGYDTDSTAFDANEHWIEVDQVTAANGASSYCWNTTGVAAGTYHLSGYIYDFATDKAVYSHLATSIVITAAPAPTFTLSGPSAGTFTPGQTVTIQWSAANVDVAGPAKITLGYDADSTAFDANEHWIEVDQVTAANGAGSYGWNTTGMAAGTYHLGGYSYDFATGKAVYSHLATSITITAVPAPTFTLSSPSAGTFTPGQSVTIQWSAANVDLAAPSKITLGYDRDATAFDANEHWIEVNQVTAANGTGSYSWNTTGVAAGTYFLSGYIYDFATDTAVYSHLGTSIVIT